MPLNEKQACKTNTEPALTAEPRRMLQRWLDSSRSPQGLLGEAAPALAYLGCLAILDERDSLEYAERVGEGETFSDGEPRGWLEEWGRSSLGERRSIFKSTVRGWRTDHVRRIVSELGECLPSEDPSFVKTAEFLFSVAPSKGSFATWFSEILDAYFAIIHDDKSKVADVSLTAEACDLLTLLAFPWTNEEVLMIGPDLWELVHRSLKAWTTSDALSPPATSVIEREGIHFLTRNTTAALGVIAAHLARGIVVPDGRILDIGSPAFERYQALGAVYDVIVCAPPIGTRLNAKAPPLEVECSTHEEYLLQWSALSLKPGGRAFVLMPRGFAFRGGVTERLRRWLLENFHVGAVIELAPGLSWTRVAVSTSLICITRESPAEPTWFLGEDLTRTQLANFGDIDSHASNVRRVLSLFVRGTMNSNRKGGTGLKDDPFGYPRRIENSEIATVWSKLICHPGVERQGIATQAAIAGNDYDLTWNRYAVRSGLMLEKALQTLASSNKSISLGKLSDIADIIPGVPYKASHLVEREDLPTAAGANPIGLLRIGDLSRKTSKFGEIPAPRRPKLFLLDEGRLEPDVFLRDHDLIISRQGTIGRVNSYFGPLLDEFESEKLRIVASNQLAIIRPKSGTASGNIAGLLCSPPYQEWLKAGGVGSVTPQLRIKDLASVPVPIAPKHLQTAIAEHLLAGHPIEELPGVLTQAPRQDASVLAFLENATLHKFTAQAQLSPEEPVSSLLDGLRKRPTAGRLGDWWDRAMALIGALDEALNASDARDRFTLLQLWLARFASDSGAMMSMLNNFRLPALEKSTPETCQLIVETVQRRAKELSEALHRVALNGCNKHLDSTKLVASLSPTSVHVATPTVLTASLVNQGDLSLRAVDVRLGESRSQTSLLMPGNIVGLPFTFTAKHEGHHFLVLEWSAKRMDGSAVTGKEELLVEAISLGKASKAGLGLNPYVDGASPVGKDGKMFYGRKEVIHRIDLALARENRTTVLLIEGNRRIGKSSLLLHYRTKCLDTNRWLPVYINFQDFGGAKESKKLTGIPDVRIFQGMARELIKAVSEAGIPVNIAGAGEFEAGLTGGSRLKILKDLQRFFEEGEPFERFKYVLDSVIAAVAPKRLLLMFDEFDRIQAGIDSGVTSDQVPENFRHLLQSYAQVAAILTGSLKIRRLRQQYWHVLFNLGQSLQLHGLDEPSARELVIDPVRGGIVYVPEAVDKIVQLTARQPLLIQVLCARLFDLCQDRHVGLVTLDMVSEAADEQVEDSENFATIWGFIESPRQRCLLLLLEKLTRNAGRVTPILLRDQAEDSGVIFANIDEFKADLDSLKDMDVIASEIEDQAEYLHLEVPLFALWLYRNQDFAVQCAAVAEVS